jgi:hypothetical protein
MESQPNKLQQVESQHKGSATMDFLLPVGILVAWIVLQAWILPRFGVST